MGTKADHLAQAARLRARAAECRELAKLDDDIQRAAQYAAIAEAYERLAQTEEALAERAPSGTN